MQNIMWTGPFKYFIHLHSDKLISSSSAECKEHKYQHEYIETLQI